MRLTLMLMKRKMPNGFIWTGKHRLAHHIYPLNIERMVKRLKIEENNLLLLRHPYLTLEQERAGEKEFKKHSTKMQEEKLEYASSRMKPSVRFEEKFNFLLKGDTWELT